MSMSVEPDGSHRIELRPNSGSRYVIDMRSLKDAVLLAHEYIIEQDFDAL